MIVLNSLSGATLLYINDGTGVLIAENDRLAASGLSFPGSKAEFCDIDRDGDNDVVYGTGGLHGNRILVNDGFGRLRNAPASLPPAYFGVTNNVAGTMACIDLNLDGWPDVVLLNLAEFGESYLSVWLNRTDLLFEKVVLFEQRAKPDRDLWGVVDANDDGWPDILLSPFPGDGALLLNDGGDAFVSQDFPWFGGSLVDANGDGKNGLPLILDMHPTLLQDSGISADDRSRHPPEPCGRLLDSYD